MEFALQNSSVQTSEAGNGVQEPSLDDQQSLYHTQQPYVYPGYMYGAPLYDYNGKYFDLKSMIFQNTI